MRLEHYQLKLYRVTVRNVGLNKLKTHAVIFAAGRDVFYSIRKIIPSLLKGTFFYTGYFAFTFICFAYDKLI